MRGAVRWIGLGLISLVVAFGIALTLDANAGSETFPTEVVTTVIELIDVSYIDSVANTTNFGTADPVIMNHSSSNNKSILMKLPLASIPTNHVIIAAHVHTILAKAMSASDSLFPIGLYRVMNNWNEAQVTYDDRETSVAWNLAGAKKTVHNWHPSGGSDTTFNDTAYDRNSWPQSVFTVPTSASVGDTIQWDVSFLVRKWHSGQWENNGFHLRFAEVEGSITSGHEGVVIQMNSEDDASPSNRPKVTVLHAPLTGRGVFMGRRRGP